MRELWYANNKDYCFSSQKEMFSCDFVLYSVCQFLQKSQTDLTYHFAKKHSAPKPDVISECKFCYEEFPGIYALRHHKKTQHGFPIKTLNVELDDFIDKVDGTNLKEELRSCQRFLVDSQLKRVRHKVSNYALEKLKAAMVDEDLDHFFKNIKHEPK